MNFEYCDGYTYTIKKGDTLYEISRSHKVPLSLLLRSNPFVDVFNLQVGDTLCIPTRQNPQRPCEVWGNCEDTPNSPDSPDGPDEPDMSDMPNMPNMPNMPDDSVQPGTPRPPQDVEWERTVVKPGDTIGKLLNGNMAYLTAFGERNGWDNVYLLPGVAYYVPEED